MIEKTDSEIKAVLDAAYEQIDNGASKYHGMTYEEDIRDAIEWIQGDSLDNPMEINMKTYFEKIPIGTIFLDYEGNKMMKIGVSNSDSTLHVGTGFGTPLINAVVLKPTDPRFSVGGVVVCQPSEYVKIQS